MAVVCEMGALGLIGAAYLTPPQIIEASRTVWAQTTRPFGTNLIAPLQNALTRPLRAVAAKRGQAESLSLFPERVEDLAVERFVSGGDSLFDNERLKINRTLSPLLWSGRLRARSGSPMAPSARTPPRSTSARWAREC